MRRPTLRFLSRQFSSPSGSRFRRLVQAAPRGCGPLSALAVAGLVSVASLGCGGGIFADQPTQDEAPESALNSSNSLLELVVDLDDRLSDGQVAALERRYAAHFVPDSGYVNHDRIYRVSPNGVAASGRLLASERTARRHQLGRLLAALRHDLQVEAADWALLYRIPESAPTALTLPADEALTLPNDPTPQDDGGRQRFLPNDPKYKFQWHMDQIHMPEAWTRNQGDGVVVAVVDTGVTVVEDLAGTELVPGWNFVDNSADTRDDHGHGTHVAGTIAQTTHNGVGVAGVAYRAKIMPIKVLSASGSGSVAGIAEGIRWATDHGARVINMSLGGPFSSQVLAKAVRYAHDKGVVVVCASGNDGRGKVSYPAANPGAIAVAATQFDESTTFYSNWGKEISIAAPGGNTRVDQNGDGIPDGVLQNTVTPGNIDKQDYLLFMGTSMASPHIAGVAALLVSAGVRDPAKVQQLIEQTARKPAAYRGRRDTHYGAGIVDANAALIAATGSATPAGTPQPGSSPFAGWSRLLAIVLGLTLVRRLTRSLPLTPTLPRF